MFFCTANDWELVAKRFCCSAVRNSSVARGIGGVDLRAEGRVERGVFHADPRRVHTLCPRPLTRSLPARPAHVRSRSDVETDAGDPSIRSSAVGLLAPQQNQSSRICKGEGETDDQKSVADRQPPHNGKNSFVSTVCCFVRTNLADTPPKCGK